MELQTQHTNTSTPSIYLSAPNSPNGYGRSKGTELYYSAPPSPRRITDEKEQKDDFAKSILDDFEFGTSKKFEYSPKLDNDHDPRCRERGDSLPAMTFADELFVNGLIMPLKLPPRLQRDSDLSFSQKSPVSSPKSPRTFCKIPFARKNAWNDEYDPFTVALDKVREEKRNSLHWRSTSQHSPFMITSKSYNHVDYCNQHGNSGNCPKNLYPSFSGPLDFKGSAYARWARGQIQEGALSPPKSPRRFLFAHKVRPAKAEQDGSTRQKKADEKCVEAKEESKVKKFKGVVLKYASFGRQNSEGKPMKTCTEVRKASYFSRLSFKFKGNGNVNTKKSVLAEDKMVVVAYKAKPSFGLCLGYGVASPSN